LFSGGLDSAVLVAEEAERGDVQPIYVSAGLAWEESERLTVDGLLESGALGVNVRPLVALAVDMTDVYPTGHWAIEGRPPGYHTPDEDVYLPGRNVVLLSKAGVYCATARISRLVLGTLDHNPFPDATPAFRSAMGAALSLGLQHVVQIDAPYADATKADVVRRGVALGLPLERTLSCMNPIVSRAEHGLPQHCGLCSKCRERHDAFLEVGVADPTHYVERKNITQVPSLKPQV
jgi:7-cyano-7-deazaguanine synthase